jgi:hypothetical protein
VNAPVATTPSEPVVVKAGVPSFGCLGWSATLMQVLCLSGVSGAQQENELAVLDTGKEFLYIDLDGQILAEDVARLNAKIGQLGYMTFTHAPTPLVSGLKLTVGAATVLFTSEETHPDNAVAATFTTTLVATCGTTTRQIYKDKDKWEAQGIEHGAAVRRIGNRLLVELTAHSEINGARLTWFQALLLNTETCEETHTWGRGEIDMGTW